MSHTWTTSEKDLPYLEAGLHVDLALPRGLERLPETKSRDEEIARLRRRAHLQRVGIEICRAFDFAFKADYCPSQPRDEMGKWSGGSGGCPKEGEDDGLVANPNAPQYHHYVTKEFVRKWNCHRKQDGSSTRPRWDQSLPGDIRSTSITELTIAPSPKNSIGCSSSAESTHVG